LRPPKILSRKITLAAASWRNQRAANPNPNGKEIVFNVLPHPGLLPRGKEKRPPCPLKNERRDWSDGLSRIRKRAKAVPSPGGEGQDEGGYKTIICFTGV